MPTECEQLENVFKQRQLDIWLKIVEKYEIDNKINSQIRKYIELNRIESEAYKCRIRAKRLR
jgi:hypothetical protein